MLPVASHPEADAELEAAARWYEDRQPGLGDGFLDDFEKTLRRVLEAPDRFPYAIIYSVEKEGLFIKAVMDLHRRPFYWRHRQ